MDFIIDAIVEWLKGLLVDGIMGNLDGLFDNVNQSVGEIATPVSYTHLDVYKRQGWQIPVIHPFQCFRMRGAAKSQGIKQLMAGGGVVLIGLQLIPLLSGLFS